MAKVGFFQFAPQLRTPHENIEYIIESLKDEHDCLVALPELFLSSYYTFEVLSLKSLRAVLTPLQGFAKKNALAFVGSLPVKKNKKGINTSYVIDGDFVTKSSEKQRLYAHEKAHFGNGSAAQRVIKFQDLSFSSSICLDVIDPKIASNALKKGTNVLIVNGTVSSDYLLTLTKARALENQMITIFANRTGSEKGIEFLGRSTIFLPDGTEVSAEGQDGVFKSIEVSPRDLVKMKSMRVVLGI